VVQFLYSGARILELGVPMSAKSKDFWAAVFSGLVVGGVIAAVLGFVVDPPISTATGALIGGAAAAYVLHGKINQAAATGALAGVLEIPFFLGLLEIFLVFELIPNPAGPTPPMSELQQAVVLILLVNVVAGAFGGAIGGATHRHPEPPVSPVPQPSAGPVQVKYCIQCGAQLHGELICPHCGARQPQ
jgi:hypothetical protein